MRNTIVAEVIIALVVLVGGCAAPVSVPSATPTQASSSPSVISSPAPTSISSPTPSNPATPLLSDFQIAKKAAFDAWDVFRTKIKYAVEAVGYKKATINISYSDYNNALSPFEKLSTPIIYLYGDMIKPGCFNPVEGALKHYKIVRSLLLDLETNEGEISHQTLSLLEKCYRDVIDYTDTPMTRTLDSILYDSQYNNNQLSDKSIALINLESVHPDIDRSCLNYWLGLESLQDEFYFLIRDAQFKE